MKYLFFAIVLALAIGCSNNPAPNSNGNGGNKGGQGPEVKIGDESAMGKPIEGLARYSLGEPITERNCTIIPVMLASNNDSLAKEDYISLTEAKNQGLVEITELPGGEEVSRLMVRNLSKKPLLLLAGELLLGGKQDRVVAKDTIVPPLEAMEVPVFCVEHGRWEGESRKFDYSSSMAPQSVREKAVNGTQQEVWDQVEAYNTQAGASKEESTSVRAGFYSADVAKRVDTDISAFTKALAGKQNVVGLVYVVNGEIGSFELFGSNSLLNASRDSLLKGFIADAAVRPTKTVKELDLEAVKKFIKDSLMGTRQQTRLTGSNANWNVSGDGMAGAEMTLPSANMMKKEGDMDQKQILHGSYTPKK